MDDREYEIWKNREEDHRAQRRKRTSKSATRKEAEYLWNSSEPIIRFENLIPHWQSIVVDFLRAARQGRTPEESWNASRGYVRRSWMKLDQAMRSSLEHVWESSG